LGTTTETSDLQDIRLGLKLAWLMRKKIALVIALFVGGFAVTYFASRGSAPPLTSMRGLESVWNPTISDTLKSESTTSKLASPKFDTLKPEPAKPQLAKEIASNNILELSPRKPAGKQANRMEPSLVSQAVAEKPGAAQNKVRTGYALVNQGGCTSTSFGSTCAQAGVGEAHAFLYKLTPIPDSRGLGGVVGSVNLITADDIIPQLSFYTTRIDIPNRTWLAGFPGFPKLTEWFGVCYDGGFDAPTAGDYRLVTAVDDSVAIWIDRYLIMNNNDGAITRLVVDNLAHGKGPDRTRYNPGPVAAPSFYLTAGLHSVMIQYMQSYPTRIGVQVWVYPPGGIYAGGVPPVEELMRLAGPPHGTLNCPH
jgi:hypothetical protein